MFCPFFFIYVEEVGEKLRQLSIICNTNTFLCLVVSGELSGLAKGAIVAAVLFVVLLVVYWARVCWVTKKNRGTVFITSYFD